MKTPRLTPSQWKLFAGAFSNISQAIIIFSLAAFFVPEVVGLSRDFSRLLSIFYLICGLIVLYGAAILEKKSK